MLNSTHYLGCVLCANTHILPISFWSHTIAFRIYTHHTLTAHNTPATAARHRRFHCRRPRRRRHHRHHTHAFMYRPGINLLYVNIERNLLKFIQ